LSSWGLNASSTAVSTSTQQRVLRSGSSTRAPNAIAPRRARHYRHAKGE